MKKYLLAPSLLSADFARLGQEAEAVLAAGADMLHFDVMDNHYVPNLTVGPLVCQALRNYGIKAPIDVHLMVEPVDRLIVDFAKAGANHITFHPEASDHVDRSLELIRSHGCKAGLALNPATTLHCLEYVFDKLDLILVMSVNPGFGGQKFIPTVLDKIKQIRQMINASDNKIMLAVDGGVNAENIAAIASAGAEMFIAGSAIFNQPDYKIAVANMRQQLANAQS
jgi:ribulose-phosphate 3-epimerase